MGIRTVCFVAARSSFMGHWVMWVFLVGAVFLPYVAVVMANARSEPGSGRRDRVRRPELQRPTAEGDPLRGTWPPAVARSPARAGSPLGSQGVPGATARRGCSWHLALQPEAAHAVTGRKELAGLTPTTARPRASRRLAVGRCAGTTPRCTRPSVATSLPCDEHRATLGSTSCGARRVLTASAGTRPAPRRGQPPMADIGRVGLEERQVVDAVARAACGAIAARQRSASSSSLGAGAQRAAQVGLLAGEQAVAHLAVGGEPDPVAVAAERPGHRGDHADGAGPAVDREQLGRARCPAAPRPSVRSNSAPSRSRISSAVTMSLAPPAVLGVERHLLDEPQLVAAVEAPAEQLGRLVVVDAAHQDGVDLDRPQPGGVGRGEPGDDVVEPVAQGELVEGLRAHGVEADVDPVEAGRGQRRARSGPSPSALVVIDSRGRGVSARAPLDDVDEPAAHQRLAAGEPHLVDAEARDRRSRTSRTTSSSVSTDVVGQPVEPLGAACSRCSAGCSGRSATPAGRSPTRPKRSVEGLRCGHPRVYVDATHRTPVARPDHLDSRGELPVLPTVGAVRARRRAHGLGAVRLGEWQFHRLARARAAQRLDRAQPRRRPGPGRRRPGGGPAGPGRARVDAGSPPPGSTTPPRPSWSATRPGTGESGVDLVTPLVTARGPGAARGPRLGGRPATPARRRRTCPRRRRAGRGGRLGARRRHRRGIAVEDRSTRAISSAEIGDGARPTPSTAASSTPRPRPRPRPSRSSASELPDLGNGPALLLRAPVVVLRRAGDLRLRLPRVGRAEAEASYEADGHARERTASAAPERPPDAHSPVPRRPARPPREAEPRGHHDAAQGRAACLGGDVVPPRRRPAPREHGRAPGHGSSTCATTPGYR